MKKNNAQFVIFITLLSVFAIFAIPVLAQDPQSDVDLDAVNAVARKMNCPTCQSLNLADCRTQTCNQWREQIADLLASGMTQEEVLDWYIARYGEEVLQEPPKHGVGLYVWILPVIGFLAGAGWLAYGLKKWSAHPPEGAVREIEAAPEPKIASPDDDYLKRVEQDLQDL